MVQLVERLLPTPEIRSSKKVISKYYLISTVLEVYSKNENKSKRGQIWISNKITEPVPQIWSLSFKIKYPMHQNIFYFWESWFPIKKLTGHPQPLFRWFSVYFKQTLHFYNKIMRKMSIQYKVLGFKPMTFGIWVSSYCP